MARKSGKTQSKLISFMASYCLHDNWVNIQISYSSDITCQNQVKLCPHKVEGKNRINNVKEIVVMATLFDPDPFYSKY